MIHFSRGKLEEKPGRCHRKLRPARENSFKIASCGKKIASQRTEVFLQLL
jgi:hypothetical protein